MAAFTLAALRTISTPRPADPVEAAVFDRTQCFAHRQAAYGEPAGRDGASVMPGLPLAASTLGGEAAPDLRTVRWLALALALLLAAVVIVAVRVETTSWTLALAGGSFTLLGQGFLTASAGVARPETAMLILAITAFTVLRATSGAVGALFAAVLLGAAFFVDQQAGWFLVAALVVLTAEDRSQLVAFVLVAGLVVGGGYVLLSRLLGPWFNYNAWDLPLASLRPGLAASTHFFAGQLLGTLGFWTLAALLSCALPLQRLSGRSGAWTCLATAAVLAGLLSAQRDGFGPAALLPALVALSVLGPISMQRVARHLAEGSTSGRHEGETVLLAAVSLQFLALLPIIPVERWLR
jgi:hypothetical protein